MAALRRLLLVLPQKVLEKSELFIALGRLETSATPSPDDNFESGTNSKPSTDTLRVACACGFDV